jgi:hypothetical protein
MGSSLSIADAIHRFTFKKWRERRQAKERCFSKAPLVVNVMCEFFVSADVKISNVDFLEKEKIHQKFVEQFSNTLFKEPRPL